MSRAALAAWGAAFAFSAACGGGGTAMPAYGGPPDEEMEPVESVDDGSGVDEEEEGPTEEVTPDPEPDDGATEEELPVPAYGGPPEG